MGNGIVPDGDRASVRGCGLFLVYRLGWLHYSPRLSWTLLGGYGFASLLTFLNVFVTARLMFASNHDLRLAAVLLIFAGGIATALGYFLSTALSEKIHWVGSGRRRDRRRQAGCARGGSGQG